MLQSQGEARYNRNGMQYGVTRGLFQGRWWDFYERGRSFADGRFWREAENDLREAVLIRSKDDRRARTYGAHFIQYFGNRELGVVLFRQAEQLYYDGHELLRNGQKKESDQKFKEVHRTIERAIKYLEDSVIRDELSDDEILTEKAQYYLKLCYRQFAKVASDNEAPVIHLDFIPAGLTNEDEFQLAGWIEEDHYVDSFTINGNDVKVTRSSGQFYFVSSLILKPGPNDFALQAIDANGNFSRQADFSITLDIDPPVISTIAATPQNVTLLILNEDEVRLDYDILDNVDVFAESKIRRISIRPHRPGSPRLYRICRCGR